MIKTDSLEDPITLETAEEEYKEAINVFPALHAYQTEHNEVNLQKLCVEVTKFCQSVFASVRNESERNIYRSMVEKLYKKTLLH